MCDIKQLSHYLISHCYILTGLYGPPSPAGDTLFGILAAKAAAIGSPGGIPPGPPGCPRGPPCGPNGKPGLGGWGPRGDAPMGTDTGGGLLGGLGGRFILIGGTLAVVLVGVEGFAGSFS